MHKVIREDIDNILAEKLSWDKFKGTNVLVTGASGMVGGYILNTLVELNKRNEYGMGIYALVRNPKKLPDEIREQVIVVQQSVTEPINIEEPIDFIVHAASPASPRIMKDDPVGTVAANTVGTFNTLQLAAKGSGKGYLYISSREIYGQPYEHQRVFSETDYGFVDPLSARSCYPEGKKAAETMCVCFKEQYGVNAKIARLAHTFGPGMAIDDGRVQCDFFRNVIRNEDILLKSDGSAIRTYTYVGDAIAAMFRILLDSDEIVYNIASEESTVSIRQLAEACVAAYPEKGLKLRFEIEGALAGTAPFTLGILSSERIRGIGWKPLYTLDEGIKRTISYLADTSNV